MWSDEDRQKDCEEESEGKIHFGGRMGEESAEDGVDAIDEESEGYNVEQSEEDSGDESDEKEREWESSGKCRRERERRRCGMR